MTAEHFVDIIKREKDSILSLYFSEDSETQVGKMIQDITNQGIAKDSLFELLNFVLNEHYYNLLLALDGESSLDGEQINYKLFDEEGNELTGSGDIETSAYEAFMEEQKDKSEDNRTKELQPKQD